MPNAWLAICQEQVEEEREHLAALLKQLQLGTPDQKKTIIINLK